MKEDKVIKAGYMMEIESWENDYDVVKIISIDGLISDEVKFYLEILHLFALNGFGNQSDVDEELLEKLINEIIEKYSLKRKFKLDNISDLLGYPENNSIMFRVYDSAKIYWIPKKIVFEDYSEEFINKGKIHV